VSQLPWRLGRLWRGAPAAALPAGLAADALGGARRLGLSTGWDAGGTCACCWRRLGCILLLHIVCIDRVKEQCCCWACDILVDRQR
jgi:hypothetical protein